MCRLVTAIWRHSYKPHNSTKHLGKCAIYEGSPPTLVHGMNLLALRVDPDVAAARYVYWILSSTCLRRKLPRITKHSVNQSSFNISRFKKLKIPLPALAEQKQIARILDAADALRAKRREALAQLDILLQSTFLDMFGDPVTNPMGWDVLPFESIGNRRLGKMLDKGKEVGDRPVSLPCEHQRSMGQIRLGSASHYGFLRI